MREAFAAVSYDTAEMEESIAEIHRLQAVIA